MVDVRRQIETGLLVCPTSKQPLIIDDLNRLLKTVDGKTCYQFLDGRIPVLLADPELAATYTESAKTMLEEYQPQKVAERGGLYARMRTRDYRTKASIAAFNSVFSTLSDDALCLSIGGGPLRQDRRFVNLNIGPFPNVDVVADAHLLPYADGTVNAIFCEAVLEHLAEPTKSVKEMRRVLKRGAKVYAATPFLQAYHGYPHHYQNYTLTGHTRLFSSAGLTVIEQGACVGPVFALLNLGYVFISEYVPSPVNWPLRKSWELLELALRPLDKLVNDRKNSHVLASTTFLVARKD